MKLDFASDPNPQLGAALGLIVLDTDETIEPECARYFAGSDLALYHSRVPFSPEVTPETLAQMEAHIPASTKMLPSSAPLSVIGYGCTSGATVIGSNGVAAAVKTIRPDVTVTDPIAASCAAFSTLNTKRIGFLTPYVVEVSAAMRARIERSGFEIAAFGSFEEIEDAAVARISPTSIQNGAAELAKQADFDTIFISCTNLRTADVISPIESELGVAVVTSNQALAWHMQRLAGSTHQLDWAGRLFQDH